MPFSRRSFLIGASGLGAIGAGAPLLSPFAGTAAAAIEVVPSFVADVAGAGRPETAHLAIVREALKSRRGTDVVPDQDYDYRADLMGRGKVDRRDLRTLDKTIDFLSGNPELVRPRPVTVAWHYGWYNFASRKPQQHHVWFKGGGYSSRSPETEALFNDLKNEFGISVDALSWADPKTDGNLNDNLVQGYFNAANGRTRHAALLYESLISLRAQPGDRIDFQKNKTRNRLVDHFRQMGRFFADLRDDSPARIFTLDGRPVIFIYASHTWGLNVDGTGPQYDWIDAAMENAVEVFEGAYGTRPYVVGEETTFAPSDRFDEGRRRRSANFDAIFNYHHASSGDFIVEGGQHLEGAYVDQVKEVLTHTYAGALEHKSRFTDLPIQVIPSLAAGFSKVNVPTLFASRASYADFLKEMIGFHEREYMLPAFGAAGLQAKVPVVSVGAWNEEWEGHAVMPSQFNRTLAPRTQKGFDYVMAIKQAFGWNHYLQRRIDTGY